MFMQWLTSKPQDVAIAKAGGSPMRNSTLTSPDMLKLYAEYAVIKEQLKYADPDWRPVIPEWSQIDEQVLGVQIFEALIGRKTPAEALQASVGPVDQIMVRDGYKKS